MATVTIPSATALPEPTDDEFAFHEMRITNHGKIHAWVDFALQFFEAHPEKALILHTLPSKLRETQDAERHATEATTEADADSNDRQGPLPTKENNQKNASVPTTTIPRLISVVEIIKREYVKMMDTKRQTELTGLHQYNEIGYLEEGEKSDKEESVEDRARMLIQALKGGNNVQVKRTAYMKVTLCRQEVPSLAKGATYQRPMKRKMSKSAWGRLKKRLKKEQAAADSDEFAAAQTEVEEAD
ncbi:hypothetical protein EW146_g4014 [Bondarzewia mesenterica]|uniref:Uncharacterized protein n=1 Tax=Bondarzewia mesenterica TaxID=1095465 RepID=A0A4S4LWB5_9AGAM|nr:hypothetical protein EW146_g4014 [Bondarzewia mesenterica]